MRRCPNCSQLASDDRKICRNCGGILVDAADQPVAATAVPPPAEPDSQPPEDEPRDFASESPPIDQRVPTDHERQDLIDQVDDQREAAGGWECPRCHVSVPRSFDVCWNCQTTRQRDEASPKEQAPETALPTEPPPVHPVQLEVIEAKLVDERNFKRSACPQCGSTKIMKGIVVHDQGQGSNGELQVVIAGNPAAMVFKDRHYAKIRADICGQCGHVQLRIKDPASLYAHYLKRRKGR